MKRLNVMRQVPVQCEQRAYGQIERPTLRSHEDMAGDGLDRDTTFCLMLWKSRMCPERGEDDTEIVILDERLGVSWPAAPTAVPGEVAPTPS